MLQRVFLLTILLYALTQATTPTHTQEESNEDTKSSFNVVSTSSGGSESSRRHIKNRYEFVPLQASDSVQAAGNLIRANYGQSYDQQHYGHSHAVGAACTETRDHNSFADTVGTHDIDDPHGHVRTGDSTSAAGLLDTRNGLARDPTIPNRPIPFNSNAPNYAPNYPQPSYPLPSYPLPYAVGTSPDHRPLAQQPGGYYQPTAGAYPHYPLPQDSVYRPPLLPQPPIGYQPHSYPHYNPHHNPHYHEPHQPHYPTHLHAHGFGNGHHGGSWDSHLKLQTEYKEDGVHTGPTHALRNNGHGFGSGFGGLHYTGAYNRPGY